MDCTAQLIINIAQHFKTGRGLATQAWEALKLSEMGQLTNESIEIIAANTGQKADAVRAALQEGIKTSLADEETMLQNAADKGYVKTTAGTLETSQHVRDLVDAYVAQAEDDMNLVNTVMLQSTQNRYQMAIQQVVNAEEAAQIEALTGAKNAAELAKQMEKVQRTINAATGSTLLGNESRQKALRGAIATLTIEGITGFIDAGGHHWTPEAYINMDIRTTVGNVARQAQKTRAAEYGVDTFQVSRHAAARPLCAPYQGWICSWSGGGYTVEDLYGNQYTVHNINETSYGQPAGLFGINCGHNPLTFVPGYSVPRAQELTPEEEQENALQYAQSQQPRYLEREVRHAKTEALAYDAAGDKEGFVLASQKVKQTQADYAAFCKQTGRTPRTDRLQVYGYNRSVSGKATAATKGYKPQAKPPKAVKPAPIIKPDVPAAPVTSIVPPFVSAETTKQANEYGTQMLGRLYDEHTSKNGLNRVPFADANKLSAIVDADYGKLPADVANTFNRVIGELATEYDTPLQTIRTMDRNEARLYKDAFAFVSHQYPTDGARMIINPVKFRNLTDTAEHIMELGERGYAVKVAKDKAAEYVATHEFAHTLLGLRGTITQNFVGLDVSRIMAARKEINTIWTEYKSVVGDLRDQFKKAENDYIMGTGTREKALEIKQQLDRAKISNYSLSNEDEFMAEAFTNVRIGTAQNDYADRVYAVINKFFLR